MNRVTAVWCYCTALLMAFVIGISTETDAGTPAVAAAVITWAALSVACVAFAAGRHGRR